jgi:hypothetical protein
VVEKTTLALLPLPPEEPDAPGEIPGPRGRVGKNPGFKKTPAQWVFVFLGFFLGLLYFCPEERVFRVFSVSRILLGASRL